jgi:methyltransferase (TIGR00027 family)
MRPDQSSLTAENNAILRAHESLRPRPERVVDDPYAHCFLPASLREADDREARIRQAVDDWERHYPGVCNAIIARTRFIDDCLVAAVSGGIRQLVILGAGYDTRALRFETLKEGVAVFELDHPTTQRTKLARLGDRLHTDLGHVRYIAIDFKTDTLADKLAARGYSPHLATLFIWEGVTYYLPATAVDRTLDAIRRLSAPGSSLGFDCFPPSVADGTTRLAEAWVLREGLAQIGEAILFGIPPDRVAAFMKSRGFRVLQCFYREDYRKAYFTGVNRHRRLSEMFLFVLASVSKNS